MPLWAVILMAKENTMPNYVEMSEKEFKELVDSWMVALAVIESVLEGARE